jgi:uncharacterized protein YbbC (DUF1343 family)
MKNHLNIMTLKNTFLFWLVSACMTSLSCQSQVLPGAENTKQYIKLLNGKNIGVVAHQASLISTSDKNIHLVDALQMQERKLKIKSTLQQSFQSSPCMEKIENLQMNNSKESI